MTESAFIDIQFKGKHLCPEVLAEKTGLPIESLVSSGEMGKIGKFKGKKMPYGIGLLKIAPTVETISHYTDKLLEFKPTLKKAHVEEIIFDVDANTEELEQLSIPGGLLKKLSALNATIQFNQHENPNDEVAVLVEKINSKLSMVSYPNQQKIQHVLDLFASSFQRSPLRGENVYALIVSFLESNNNKRISRKSLERAAKDYGKM